MFLIQKLSSVNYAAALLLTLRLALVYLNAHFFQIILHPWISGPTLGGWLPCWRLESMCSVSHKWGGKRLGSSYHGLGQVKKTNSILALLVYYEEYAYRCAYFSGALNGFGSEEFLAMQRTAFRWGRR